MNGKVVSPHLHAPPLLAQERGPWAAESSHGCVAVESTPCPHPGSCGVRWPALLSSFHCNAGTREIPVQCGQLREGKGSEEKQPGAVLLAGFLPRRPLPPFPGTKGLWPVRSGSQSLGELGPATSLSTSVLSSVKWADWTR